MQEVGSRLCERHTGFETSETVQVIAGRTIGIGSEGRPKVDPVRKNRSTGKDADHHIRLLVEFYDPSKHLAAALKRPLPEVIVQQNDPCPAGLIFLRPKIAADHRLQTKDIQHV